MDPFGDPSVNVSDDRLKSRLKAELGRSAMTTLLVRLTPLHVTPAVSTSRGPNLSPTIISLKKEGRVQGIKTRFPKRMWGRKSLFAQGVEAVVMGSLVVSGNVHGNLEVDTAQSASRGNQKVNGWIIPLLLSQLHDLRARSFLLVICLQDTRSHSTLLGDIGAGMMTSASYRRRATRAEAEEAFNRQLRPTRSVRRYVLHPPDEGLRRKRFEREQLQKLHYTQHFGDSPHVYATKRNRFSIEPWP